jgi:hypothetical protein
MRHSFSWSMRNILIICAVVSVSASAQNYTIDYKYVDLLLKHINVSSGLDIPKKGTKKYPKILFVSTDAVYKLVCPVSITCNAVAAAKSNLIMLTKYVDLDTPEGDSILYHELVHVAQWYTKGTAKTCKEWADNEIQAYQLQYKYSQSKGRDMDMIYKWIHNIRKRCN